MSGKEEKKLSTGILDDMGIVVQRPIPRLKAPRLGVDVSKKKPSKKTSYPQAKHFIHRKRVVIHISDASYRDFLDTEPPHMGALLVSGHRNSGVDENAGLWTTEGKRVAAHLGREAESSLQSQTS
jgi:hypothetical protein